MIHEGHAGASPAHRRSQTPASPSAMMFRRSGNQLRDDNDMSWPALFRRHKFLLFMLGLLTFLCFIYLYFAITVASDECSRKTGNEKASCFLKKAKISSVKGHRNARSLLSIQDSRRVNMDDCKEDLFDYAQFQVGGKLSLSLKDSAYHTRLQKIRSNTPSKFHSSANSIRVLFICCKEGNWIEDMLNWNTLLISGMGASYSDVELLFEKGIYALLLTFADARLSLSRNPSDLIVCDACDIPWLTKGGKQYLEREKLFQSRWCFFSSSGMASSLLSNVAFDKS